MVAIRRRVVKKKRGSPPNFAALLTARNAIASVLLFFGFRLLWRFVSSSSSSNPPAATSDAANDHGGQNSISNALKDSRQSLRRGAHKNHPPPTPAGLHEDESPHENNPASHHGDENPHGNDPALHFHEIKNEHIDPEDHSHDVHLDKQESENIPNGQSDSTGKENPIKDAVVDAVGDQSGDTHESNNILNGQSINDANKTEKLHVGGESGAGNTTEKQAAGKEQVAGKSDMPPPTDEHLENSNETSNSNSDALGDGTQDVLLKNGSGPTKLGYVADLVRGRKNPTFRTIESPLDHEEETNYHSNLESTISKHLEGKVSQVHACEKAEPIDGNQIIDRRLVLDKKCFDEDTRLVAFNGADFSRHVCGQELTPGSSMLLEDDCHLLQRPLVDADAPPPIHLLPHDEIPISPNSGMMPPIQVSSTRPSSAEDTAKLEFEDIPSCDIPCQFEKGIDGVDRYVIGTDWEVTWTERDPALDRHASIERTDYRHDHYYATTSWKSSIPLSSFSFDKFDFRQAKPIDFDSAKNAATSVIDNHCSNTPVRRQKWLASAQGNLKEAHFYGSCQHNTAVPEGSTIRTTEGRIELMKQDRIVLAYEEGTEKYHVTDIVWEALMSGAVPAILGAQNLHEILPPKSALFASNFNHWDKFSQYIQEVSDSKEKWESFQTWRSDEVALAALEEKLNFTRTSPECRMCRWAYSKRYGLGWNHAQQVVREPSIARKFCLSSHSNHVLQPFVESFHGGTAPHEPPMQEETDEKEPTSCQGKDSHLHVDSFGIHRTVWNHDGFTDMTFRMNETMDSSNTDGISPVTLRLQVKVQNQDGAIFNDVHTLIPKSTRTKYISSAAIQDESAKVTILANWATTSIRSPAMGLLEIDMPSSISEGMWDEPKLRIIIDDFNALHDKLTEYYPSSYTKMAMKDFIDPLELFYVSS